MTRPKLSPAQKNLQERVLKTYIKPFGFRCHHPDWGRNLWKKPYCEIVEYLKDRFRTTLDEVEYYACMVYLFHEIPDHELFVEFGDAPQVVAARKTYFWYGSENFEREKCVFAQKQESFRHVNTTNSTMRCTSELVL